MNDYQQVVKPAVGGVLAIVAERAKNPLMCMLDNVRGPLMALCVFGGASVLFQQTAGASLHTLAAATPLGQLPNLAPQSLVKAKPMQGLNL